MLHGHGNGTGLDLSIPRRRWNNAWVGHEDLFQQPLRVAVELVDVDLAKAFCVVPRWNQCVRLYGDPRLGVHLSNDLLNGSGLEAIVSLLSTCLLATHRLSQRLQP